MPLLLLLACTAGPTTSTSRPTALPTTGASAPSSPTGTTGTTEATTTGATGADTGPTSPPEGFACPHPAELSITRIHYATWNPCVLDPTVSGCQEPPNIDTHDNSLRLHRVHRRITGPLRDELLLFLPPGPGESNHRLMDWFAFSGFTVLSLGWNNRPIQGDVVDETSWRELIHGDATDPLVDQGENDALMGRLDTFMAFMVEQEPTGGWDRWWSPTTGMDWSQVVLAGWSDGATAAAYVARDVEVASVLLISGPRTMDWLGDERATPGCAHRMFYHHGEGIPDASLDDIADALDLDRRVVDVDLTDAPYDDAQLLVTGLTDFQEDYCWEHSAMARDGCMSSDLIEPYLHLACTAMDTCAP